jgi:DNA invertase Pin-like site-specific DNA recombinase
MRVSTGRQAEHDLSIPDQRRQLGSWCRGHGYAVVAEFVEAGASAGDDKRPVFQQMIERACDGENAFDVIVVHSYSRFFREAFEQEFYLRKLAKHKVRVVSITQPVGDENEPVQAMMRKVIALFDEYQSKENAKHVIRSMKENASQGFWNGATAPLGYKLVEAEKRGTKIKKKLDIDPVEAECVRLIYKLYLYGDGTSGALGIKEVVKWLNRNGHRTRRCTGAQTSTPRSVAKQQASRSTPMQNGPGVGGTGAVKPLGGRFTPQSGGHWVGVLGSDERSMSAARGKIAVCQS